MRVSQNYPKENSLLIVLTLDLCHSKYYRENVQQRRVYIYIYIYENWSFSTRTGLICKRVTNMRQPPARYN